VTRLRRLLGVVVPALAVSAWATSPASAASTIGSTEQSPTQFCPDNTTVVQATPPTGTSYSAAAAGVITQWRLRTGGQAATARFKTFRQVDASSYLVATTTGPVTAPSGSLSSFPARVSVLPGDLIGVTFLSGTDCFVASDGNIRYAMADPGPGTTASFLLSSNRSITLAATLEPDADVDGYGDETQDACPSQAGPAACDTTGPIVEFTAGPSRTARRSVRFRFTSDDPAAAYECRIRGRHITRIELQKFRPCSSPVKYKHLDPGSYRVFVRATDALGNVGEPVRTKLRVVRG